MDSRARLALRVLRLVLVALLFVVALAASDRHNTITNLVAVFGPTAAAFCALIAAAKRGHVALAGWALVGTFWVLVTVVVFLFGGLMASNAVAYGIVVMVAGTLVGRRAALAVALASVAGAGAGLHAELHGWLPTSVAPMTPFNAFIAVTTTLLLTAVLHDMAMRSVSEALHAASAALLRLRASEAENETRAMQGAALGRLGERALAVADAVEIVRDAVEIVTSLLPADQALLLIAGESLTSFRVDVAASRIVATTSVVTDAHACGLDRVLAEQERALEPKELKALSAQLGLPPSATALAVVVPGRHAPHGVLVAFRDQPQEFSRAQRQFATTLASMMGSALEREATEALALRAQKMEAVGRLAGGVAHDFNNLLTVMITVASELRELGVPSAEAALDDLDTATQGAVLLSNQLLALSRRKQLETQALDLGSLVADLLPMMRRLVGGDVKVQEQLEQGPGVTVLGDRSGLEQVLLNLIMNARQAMPRGGTITVSVRPASDGYVELDVADNGAGMDEATRARIFHAFFTTKPDGSGLGLATVAKVIERHGGNVSVESAVGKGSTFTVRLPALGAVRSRKSERPGGASSAQPTPQTPPVGAILLVDDHELLRQTTTRVLHSVGFDVVAKASAIEALELLASPRRFALLITDVNMPGLRGTALVEELDRLRLDTPVLFISGFVDPTTSSAAGRRRTHFLAKPFLPEQLVAAVNACLKIGD